MSRLQYGNRWLPVLMIIAAGTLVYANSLSAPFVFDDMPAIVNNPQIRSLQPIGHLLRAPSSAQPVVQRPVIAVSLALNYALGGLNVFGYHAFNLLVHLLTALVLFGLVRRTLLQPGLPLQYREAATGLGLSASLIWTVHPLLTESVTYTIQRTELVMGLCYVSTLYSVLRGAQATHHRGWWYGAAIGWCAIGMASKQAMATAPLAVLLYDRLFLSKSWAEVFQARKVLYAGLAATWLLLIALVVIGPPVETAGLGLEHLSPLDNLNTQWGIVAHYLRLAFWPSGLVISYDWPTATTSRAILPYAALIITLLCATAILLQRASRLGLFGAWWVLTIGPSSLWPVVTEKAAERRMYLPLMARVVLTVIGGCRILDWRSARGWSSRRTWRSDDSTQRGLSQRRCPVERYGLQTTVESYCAHELGERVVGGRPACRGHRSLSGGASRRNTGHTSRHRLIDRTAPL